MIVDDQARGNPPRTQVGGRSHCPWVTVGDRSFRPFWPERGRGRGVDPPGDRAPAIGRVFAARGGVLLSRLVPRLMLCSQHAKPRLSWD
jgi:hypothetical protein